ncbi:MAG: LysR family transcriptional regulator [Hyphomicrobiaceae bacterium]
MRNSDHLAISGRLLTVFLTVYDTNSVGRAAEALDINQSSVSHSLDNLRTILGDQLFIKQGRGITPTERAIALAPEVRSLLASLEGMIRRSDYDPMSDDRAVRLAGNVDALSYLFSEVRDRLFAAAPNLKLQFIEAGARNSFERLLDLRQADVVVGARALNYSGALISEELMTSRMVCYTDRNVRKSIRSLRTYVSARHAVVDFGAPGKSIVDEAMEVHSVQRNIALRAPSFHVLGKMVEGTDLVATMPEYLGKTVFASFAKSRPPLPIPDVKVDMVWHRRSDRSARNIWLRELIRSCADVL